MLSKHRISRRVGSLSSESYRYYMDLLALDLNKERLLTILFNWVHLRLSASPSKTNGLLLDSQRALHIP